MIKKIVCAAIAIVLIVAAVMLLPGGLNRLQGGEVAPSPVVLPESSLTEAEVSIPAEDVDPAWNAPKALYVRLDGDTISVPSIGTTLSEDGRVLTIRQSGTYVFSGELHDGQIIVDVAQGRVHLVLNGASIHCERSSPIYVRQASAVRILAEAGTVNRLSDGAEYDYMDPLAMEPDATVFSEDDLILCGTGELQIVGSFRDAIHGKDRVTIADLSLDISAKEDGVVARDALLLRGATLDATCGLDCLKATNLDPAFGYVYAESGVYNLYPGNDAIQAENRMLITGGDFYFVCGGGYAYPNPLESCKGLKAVKELVITGGNFEIDSSDDSIHADERLSVTGGTYSLYAGDDAMLAKEMYIGGGDIQVRTCLEGMVAEVMEIAGGNIYIASQMDGVNARIRALTSEGSFDLYPDGTGLVPSTAELYITGGTLVVNADRDAVCVRGTMLMSGGLALLAGPEFTGGDPLDCDVGFTMTGGTLFAVGRTTYLPTLAEGSTASVLEATFAEAHAAHTPVCIRQGEDALITIDPPRQYYKMVVFSTILQEGRAYTLCAGGIIPEEKGYIFHGDGLLGDHAIGNFEMTNGVVSLTEGGKQFPDDYYDEEIL